MDTISSTRLSPDTPNPIFIYRETHSGFRRAHRHDFFEIGLVKQGSGVQATLSGEQALEPGDLFIIPPSAWHGLTEAHTLQTEFCCFSAGLLHAELSGLMEDSHMRDMLGIGQRSGDGIRAMKLSVEDRERYLQYTDTIFSAAGGVCSHDEASKLMHPDRILAFWQQLANLTLFLVFLCERYRACKAMASMEQAVLTSAISDVVARMEANPQYPWTLEELAKVAYLEPCYFIRRFRKEVGIPPLRYLFHLRMQWAAELLISSSKSISQVAEESGIPQPSHFSARFREYFRLSPIEYRRLFKGAT